MQNMGVSKNETGNFYAENYGNYIYINIRTGISYYLTHLAIRPALRPVSNKPWFFTNSEVNPMPQTIHRVGEIGYNLVGAYPSEKYGFVSWDDDIPN